MSDRTQMLNALKAFTLPQTTMNQAALLAAIKTAEEVYNNVNLPVGLMVALCSEDIPEEYQVEDDKTEVLCCPKCKTPVDSETSYFEDICNKRSVSSFEGNQLTIDGLYETDGCDDGDNERLMCASCDTEFTIPKSVEVDFV